MIDARIGIWNTFTKFGSWSWFELLAVRFIRRFVILSCIISKNGAQFFIPWVKSCISQNSQAITSLHSLLLLLLLLSIFFVGYSICLWLLLIQLFDFIYYLANLVVYRHLLLWLYVFLHFTLFLPFFTVIFPACSKLGIRLLIKMLAFSNRFSVNMWCGGRWEGLFHH